MDTHLSSLEATLAALAQLHNRTAIDARSPRPFTAAVINSLKLDVLDFIRDADTFEASLFWYPTSSTAAGTSGKAATSGGRVPAPSLATTAHAVDDAVTAPRDQLGAPKVPERREYVPPTPLKKTTHESGTQGIEQFDARTLLKAAQKLMDNYHNAPRARKHVKTLLRKHTEMQRQIQSTNAYITQTEDLISRLSHPTQGKQFVSSLREPKETTSTSSTNRHGQQSRENGSLQEEKRGLIQDIKREEMEMMAIEQTVDELLAQKREKDTASSRIAEEARLGSVSVAAMSPDMEQREDMESTATEAAQQFSSATGEENQADETIRLKPQSATEASNRSSATPPTTSSDAVGSSSDPISTTLPPSSMPLGLQTSDELERICESIWSVFGDHLRFAMPDREIAGLHETLSALQSISVGQAASPDEAGSGNISMLSASNATQTTAATSGSTMNTSSSLLPNAGQPAPATMVAAHALGMLLMTPPPHNMDFDEIKQDADGWWRTVGLPSFQQQAQQRQGSTRSGSAGIVADDTSNNSGDALARKAIYDLSAKKLLKLRFAGARRIVYFPANIH